MYIREKVRKERKKCLRNQRNEEEKQRKSYVGNNKIDRRENNKTSSKINLIKKLKH